MTSRTRPGLSGPTISASRWTISPRRRRGSRRRAARSSSTSEMRAKGISSASSRIRTASSSTFPSMAGSAPTAARIRSLDELVGVEILHRHLLGDDILRKIEVLQPGEAFAVHLAQPVLSRIDELGVILERSLDARFLALPVGNELDEVGGGYVWIVHDVLHAMQRRGDELLHQLRLLLDQLLRGGDALRHVREELVGRQDAHLDAGGLHRRDPVGNACHADRLAGGDELPYAGRPG